MLAAEVKVAHNHTITTCLDEKPCTCSCAQELMAVRKLLERTQGLCTESTVKFRRAAMDAYTLSGALNTVQASLNKGTDALEKAQQHADSSSDERRLEDCTGGSGGSGSSAAFAHGKRVNVAISAESVAICLKAMNTARQQTVFSRLHGGEEDDAAQARRKARRERLLKDTFTAVYPGTIEEPSKISSTESKRASDTGKAAAPKTLGFDPHQFDAMSSSKKHAPHIFTSEDFVRKDQVVSPMVRLAGGSDFKPAPPSPTQAQTPSLRRGLSPPRSPHARMASRSPSPSPGRRHSHSPRPSAPGRLPQLGRNGADAQLSLGIGPSSPAAPMSARPADHHVRPSAPW